MTTRVLLTRGLSNVRDAIALIHRAMTPGEFHLGATYATEHTPLRLVADWFGLEPTQPDPEIFLDWLLTLCRERNFSWVWPQGHWSLLLDEQARFAAAGVRLILPCPDTETLHTVQDKARANARLADVGVPMPYTLTVATAAEFDAARTLLLDRGNQRLCVKPVRSIYGLGFRVIDDDKRPLDRFLANDHFTVGSAEFAGLLALADGQRPFLVMEYLPGDERSIDCLAHEGRLVRAVVRRKPAQARGRWQLIEDDPEGRHIAGCAIASFGLNGLVNVQTRERIHPDGRREQCFLEVNPRMSGGIDMACQAGLNLPYWLLRRLTGAVEEADIPWPTDGVRVAKVEQAVALPS